MKKITSWLCAIIFFCIGFTLAGCGEETAELPPDEDPPDDASSIALPEGLQARLIGEGDEVEIYRADTEKVHSLSGKVTLPTYFSGFPVTTLGEFLFDGCEQIEEVVLPQFLTKIGKRALSYCTALKELVLPFTLTEIGTAAFEKDSALTEIVLPEGLTMIGKSAFAQCTALQPDLIIPRSVKSIEYSAFTNCGARRVFLPECVEKIEVQVFAFQDIYTDAKSRMPGWQVTRYQGYWEMHYCNKFYDCEFGYDGDIPYVRSINTSAIVDEEKIPYTGEKYLIRPYYLPHREGYEFKGWSTAEGGEVEFGVTMFDPKVDDYKYKGLYFNAQTFEHYGITGPYPTALSSIDDWNRMTPNTRLYAVWEPIS